MDLIGKCALVVDDDDLVREVLADFLVEQGASVHSVDNGRSALRYLRTGAVADLVVTDIVMPDMEGIELIQIVRKERPAMKIIAISGGGTGDPTSYLDAARRLGANGTLGKPFGPESLAQVIANI